MRRLFRARLARGDPFNNEGCQFVGALSQRADTTRCIGCGRWLFDGKSPLRPNALAFEGAAQAQYAAAAVGSIEHLLEPKQLGTLGAARWIFADRADFAGAEAANLDLSRTVNNAAGDMTHWL